MSIRGWMHERRRAARGCSRPSCRARGGAVGRALRSGPGEGASDDGAWAGGPRLSLVEGGAGGSGCGFSPGGMAPVAGGSSWEATRCGGSVWWRYLLAPSSRGSSRGWGAHLAARGSPSLLAGGGGRRGLRRGGGPAPGSSCDRIPGDAGGAPARRHPSRGELPPVSGRASPGGRVVRASADPPCRVVPRRATRRRPCRRARGRAGAGPRARRGAPREGPPRAVVGRVAYGSRGALSGSAG